MELLYKHGRRGIQPVMVRVGRDAEDPDLLTEGGVAGRCRRYNPDYELFIRLKRA